MESKLSEKQVKILKYLHKREKRKLSDIQAFVAQITFFFVVFKFTAFAKIHYFTPLIKQYSNYV